MTVDFLGGSDGKKCACNAGDLGLILGWEDPLEEGMATRSTMLAWRIPVEKRSWWSAVHRIAKSQTQLSN